MDPVSAFVVGMVVGVFLSWSALAFALLGYGAASLSSGS